MSNIADGVSNVISGVFGGGNKPAPPPSIVAPAAPPKMEDAAASNQASRDQLRTRRGAAASILTSPTGVEPAASSIGTKTLLGA